MSNISNERIGTSVCDHACNASNWASNRTLGTVVESLCVWCLSWKDDTRSVTVNSYPYLPVFDEGVFCCLETRDWFV